MAIIVFAAFKPPFLTYPSRQLLIICCSFSSNVQAVDVARLWGQLVASCQRDPGAAKGASGGDETAGTKDEDEAMMDLGKVEAMAVNWENWIDKGLAPHINLGRIRDGWQWCMGRTVMGT